MYGFDILTFFLGSLPGQNPDLIFLVVLGKGITFLLTVLQVPSGEAPGLVLVSKT